MLLADVEILITGWGSPVLDARALAALPHLKMVIHSAGTVKKMITADVWDRGIRVSSAADANAVPVAEFTLAMILLAGKDVLGASSRYAATRELGLSHPSMPFGNFGATVGIVGASRVGRRVLDLLLPFDLRALVHDPYATEHQIPNGTRVTDLDTLLATSDVVSLHAPLLPTTRHMIGRRELAIMRDGSTLINTARGGLVETDALVDELRAQRLNAILDVTDPEPLPRGHALFKLPNAHITPHMAGSLGNELQRLGRHVVDEIESYLLSHSLSSEITITDLQKIA
jgi:phosphoglycerate dehydrogenase-like enzyme